MKRCILLHQAVDPGAPPDEQEVLSTASSVARALRAQGWHTETLVLSADLAAAATALSHDPPDLVFNLVDSLGGSDALAVAAPALLQHLGLRFTGARLAAYALTADKVATRTALRACGIAVPPAPGEGWRRHYIVKNSTAHSSAGISPRSVVAHPGGVPKGHFAEAFIDGREINVSLLHGEVLPIAELAFEDWPDDLPRVNDYEAKWDTASLAYARINRRFGLDEALSARLGTIARECWRALGLRGYARVDFRLDAEGVTYVIDVNTNPCLDEDAGFAAAAAQAGLTYEAMILRIAEGEEHPAIPPAQCHVRASVAIREELRPGDDIGALCRATGFFTDPEVAIAEELAEDRRACGAASAYRFVLADGAGGLCGYACYGAIPGTRSGWDLYWIVVDPDMQGHGVGGQLLDAVMSRVSAAGGVRLYAETSGKPLYAPTRAFYEGTGFTLQASLPDFYAPGDAKLIWARSLDAPTRPHPDTNVNPASSPPATDRKTMDGCPSTGQSVRPVVGIKVAEILGKGRGVIATESFAIGDILERAPVIVLGTSDTEKIVDTVLLFYHFCWGSESTAIACGYGSMYNHSAKPNAVYQKDLEANELIFVAVRPIAAGDEVTVNYNGDPEDKTPIIFDGNGWYKA